MKAHEYNVITLSVAAALDAAFGPPISLDVHGSGFNRAAFLRAAGVTP